MSLTAQHLNGDCTFLLAFAPAFTTPDDPHRFPGAFTILLDPWLAGSSSVFHPSFQYTKHLDKPHVSSLADLKQDVDLIIISQDKPDHCHRETLCSLPRGKKVNILATPAAVKKINSWNHFDPANVHALPSYRPENPESLIRITLPAYTKTSSPGEITIAHLPTPRDLTRVHNGLAITYRPPDTIFSQTPNLSSNPTSTSTSTSTSTPTLSLLYTPHGLPLRTLHPYLTHHHPQQTTHPLTALLHPFNTERNPPCLGGNIVRGAPGGLELLSALQGRVGTWIGAHDAQLERRGWSVKWLRSRVYGAAELEKWVREEGWGTGVRGLRVGECVRLGG